jgi:hypothetical protein
VRINADFFDARKRSAGLRVVNALAVAEILAVINTSSRCRISAWSRIGGRIALAARNPALQIVAVVVDGAPETQEWWCITTSGDALQSELLSLNRSGPAENDVCNATGGLSRFGAAGIMREREP